jgi:lipopolysaccharide transport system ATP-binding protein
MPAVTRLCQRVIMLSNGQLVDDGPAHEIVAKYMHEGTDTSAERVWPDIASAPGAEVVRLRRVRIKQADGQLAPAVDIRTPVGIEMTFEVLEEGYSLLPHFDVMNEEGICAFVTLDLDPTWRGKKRPKGTYVATAWVPGNYLAEGSFFINAGMVTVEPHRIMQFWEQEAVSFQVIDRMEGDSARGDWAKELSGVVRPMLNWETDFSA